MDRKGTKSLSKSNVNFDLSMREPQITAKVQNLMGKKLCIYMEMKNMSNDNNVYKHYFNKNLFKIINLFYFSLVYICIYFKFISLHFLAVSNLPLPQFSCSLFPRLISTHVYLTLLDFSFLLTLGYLSHVQKIHIQK